METVILKIGGSVITDKHSETPMARPDVIARLAKEVADGYDPSSMRLVLIHGAGSYGHQIVRRTGINNGITRDDQKIAFAETQRLQNDLDSIVTRIFIDAGVPTIPVLASSHAVMEKGRLLRMDTEAIEGFLGVGLVPTLYGVPAFDTHQKCSILSGDQIAPFLAEKLGASRIIHGTNVDGIFTADPKKDASATPIKEINAGNLEDVKRMLGVSAAVDVTGGMFGKVNEIIELSKRGVRAEALVVNALREGAVRDALLGKNVAGTWIRL